MLELAKILREAGVLKIAASEPEPMQKLIGSAALYLTKNYYIYQGFL